MRRAEAVTKTGRSDVEVERVDDRRIIRHYIPLDAISGLLIDGLPVRLREVPNIEILLGWLKVVPA
jgi:hypothetical protein